MVKRAAPKGRKRPRKGEDAIEEGDAGFFLLDDDDQQRHSDEQDEEQQETAEQKRIRLGRQPAHHGLQDDSSCSSFAGSSTAHVTGSEVSKAAAAAAGIAALPALPGAWQPSCLLHV